MKERWVYINKRQKKRHKEEEKAPNKNTFKDHKFDVCLLLFFKIWLPHFHVNVVILLFKITYRLCVCASLCVCIISVCVHVCRTMMYTGALMHGWRSEKKHWGMILAFILFRDREYLVYYCLYQGNCPVSLHELSWPHLPSHHRTLWLQIHNTCWMWALGFKRKSKHLHSKHASPLSHLLRPKNVPL